MSFLSLQTPRGQQFLPPFLSSGTDIFQNQFSRTPGIKLQQPTCFKVGLLPLCSNASFPSSKPLYFRISFLLQRQHTLQSFPCLHWHHPTIFTPSDITAGSFFIGASAIDTFCSQTPSEMLQQSSDSHHLHFQMLLSPVVHL